MKKWNKTEVKKLRAHLGLSQDEFAQKLGCRQQTISEWELGLYQPKNAYSRLLTALAELHNYKGEV